MPLFSPVRFAIAVGAALLAVPCPAQTSTPEYGIREAEPRVGSSIKRYALQGSPIPINKRYNELSAEEKASLNQYYEKMEAGDEPPFPIDGLQPVYDAIRKAQAKLLVVGELILVASVNAVGEVTEVKTVGSPSPAMTNFAASVLLLTKFKPALCQGVACEMGYPFQLDFAVK